MSTLKGISKRMLKLLCVIKKPQQRLKMAAFRDVTEQLAIGNYTETSDSATSQNTAIFMFVSVRT